jgi:thioredoxin 1
MEGLKISLVSVFIATLSALQTTAQVIQIDKIDSYNELIKETKPMVIQFAANWCGVCQKTKQPFEQVASESEFKHITFARVDIDALGQAGAQENNIIGVPTFVYRNKGVKKDESVGIKSMDGFKDELRDSLRKNLSQETTEQIEPTSPSPDIKHEAAPAPAPEKPVPVPTDGYLPKVKDFFILIIKKIAGFVTMVLHFIKKLFGK